MDRIYYIPIREKQEKILTLIDRMYEYEDLVVISTVVVFFVYIFFRNKINTKYILDIFIMITVLLVLYIILAPHRYHGFAYFMVMSFR